MRFTLPGWAREPILWIGGIVAAANIVLGVLTSDMVDLMELWESIGILTAALVGRSQVTPV